METNKRGRNSEGRVEGTGPADAGGDGNNAAASLISSIPVIFYFLVRSHLQKAKLWKRLLLVYFLGHLITGVIAINSRGSFIGMALSCGYMGFWVFVNKKVTTKQRFQLIATVIIGLATFLALADDTFWERMASISEASEDESGGGGRKIFWAIAWNLTKIYPLGVGGWGFAYLSPNYVPAEYMPRNAAMRAVHSLYFQCLVERGYLGCAIWWGLILSSIFFIRKAKKYNLKKRDLSAYFLGLAVEAGFMAFLLAATFLNRLNSEILYWQPLFIACYGNVYMLKAREQEAKAKRAVIRQKSYELQDQTVN